jgi:hypothetical protein
MRGSRTVLILLLCGVFSMGVAGSIMAGASSSAKAQQFEGQIKSIKVDKCGLQPGSCEGSVILVQKAGGEVTLAIKPGTWLKRGDQLVTIDELGIGNYVKAEAVQLPGQQLQQITILSSGD